MKIRGSVVQDRTSLKRNSEIPKKVRFAKLGLKTPARQASRLRRRRKIILDLIIDLWFSEALHKEMGGLDSYIRDRSNAKLASSNAESQKRSAIGVAG